MTGRRAAAERNGALRVLLEHAIDYAGLFPPAALPMAPAVSNYAAYRDGGDAWALGRFVVPVARLGELGDAARPFRVSDGAWPLSAIAGNDPSSDAASARAFNATHAGRLCVDTIEAKATAPEQVASLATAFAGFTLFVEIVPGDALGAMLDAIRRAGVGAKIRTGGVVPDAFPGSRDVARFIRRCVAARIPFKATAGLHHPVRGEFPLTYAADAPRGTMFGYLNVFLAAALAVEGGDEEALVRVLDERDRTTLTLGDDGIRWGPLHLTTEALSRARVELSSFGSCSFREPLDELAPLTSLTSPTS